MTREEAKEFLEKVADDLGCIGIEDEYTRGDGEKMLEAIKALEQEPEIERKIREELKLLQTYRVPNSETDLVTRISVERVLNFVFRGHRDQEPKIESEDVE